ncbi:hypothetical protein CGJ96_04230 [Vibrio parahaemolyticus]|nr:hypothetical protein CGJ96_04230 [Vibrio parahaemolyticus]
MTKIYQHQRNHTKEIARKLETVNGEVKASTTHIVPPERTLKAHLTKCNARKRNR